MRENGGKLPLTCGNGVALHGWFSGNARQLDRMADVGFSAATCGTLPAMATDPVTHEHARLLRQAMAEQGKQRRDLATLVGRSYRTVGNWISETKPTMPSDEERATLRRLLGDYMAADRVERAIKATELVEWRQNAVITEYQRHLHEQEREDRAG